MVIREVINDGLQLEDAFFETEMRPVYWNDQNNRQHMIPGQRAIIDKKAGKAISIVSTGYHFIHNYDAYLFADTIIKRVFNGLTLKDFYCYNVYMPKSKGSCRIDLLPYSKDLFPNLKDSWLPFVRISNSYNKTLVLKYEIGFCRWICKNGVIFDQHGITIRISHSEYIDKNRIKIKIDLAKEVKGIQSLIDNFSEKINKLVSFKLTESPGRPEWLALAMYCKVFNIIVKDDEKIDIRQIEAAKLIIDRAQEYFEDFGFNAYAIFNILTDYATFPVNYDRQSIYIHGLQRKVGNWADEFIAEIQKPDFSLDDYIGEDVIKSASFLESLID